jgi:glycosyltransferase involved in cell wall biosynthesis
MNFKFSIITANYNNGKFLPDLIESIRKQTYKNWELIITDDFSSDNSLAVLENYSNDRRIKVFIHKKNQGAAAAFRTSVKNATGDIIGMLGADDALLPTAIEEMVFAHAKNTNASLICSNLYKCDENLNILSVWENYKQPAQKGGLIFDISVGSFATFKKNNYEQTEGFNPFFKKALDHDLYLKLEEVGMVVYFDKPLYLYRSNPIGISQNNEWMRALQYSTIAKKHAYHRRKASSFEVNLSHIQYANMLSLWHKREAQYFYTKKEIFKIILNQIKASWYRIISIFL